MANNDTLFSTSLGRGLTEEECQWLKDEYQRMDDQDATDEEGVALNEFGAGFDYDDGVVYSMECGDGERAVEFIQRFLAKWRPTQYIVFEMAMTCSKARCGEFGGSVCLVTATEQYWNGTSSWGRDKARELGLKDDQEA